MENVAIDGSDGADWTPVMYSKAQWWGLVYVIEASGFSKIEASGNSKNEIV
jgi:hypothetical protein